MWYIPPWEMPQIFGNTALWMKGWGQPLRSQWKKEGGGKNDGEASLDSDRRQVVISDVLIEPQWGMHTSDHHHIEGYWRHVSCLWRSFMANHAKLGGFLFGMPCCKQRSTVGQGSPRLLFWRHPLHAWHVLWHLWHSFRCRTEAWQHTHSYMLELPHFPCNLLLQSTHWSVTEETTTGMSHAKLWIISESTKIKSATKK